MAQNDDEILATISAAPARRWMGVLSLFVLGLLVVWIALSQSPGLGWQLFLLVVGAGALFMADRMRLATARVIELTRDELRDSSGIVIAKLSDIASVDRGAFAFKPSNGMMIRTKTRGTRSWNPGMWWRLGRQIGIGGVTPGHQAKFMAELIQKLLLEPEEPSSQDDQQT